MPAASSPERVCVVLLTGLGDVVHGLPVVNAIRAQRPNTHVTWVVEPMPAAVLRAHPSVDEVVVFRRRAGWRGVRQLRREMRQRRFDTTLNLNVYFKSIWPTLFSRAPRRLGFDRPSARDGTWLAATELVPARPEEHTQDRFLDLLPALGVARPEHPEWRMGFTDREEAAAAAFFAGLEGRPVAAIVPAAARAEKDWPAERFAAVADALEREHGFRTVLVGGPGEREQRIAREISARARAAPLWAMGDDVRRLMWLLRGSNLVIAPDTGPVHLARAFGVPTVGLYGHTNPLRVGPYRWCEDLWVDRYNEPGAPPSRSNAPRPGRMERITVGDVLERVQLAVERYRGETP